MDCEASGCEESATVELHIPWKENEFVCAGHARVKSRQEGVVAELLDGVEKELPDGAANRR